MKILNLKNFKEVLNNIKLFKISTLPIALLSLMLVSTNVSAQSLDILVFTRVEQAFRHADAEVAGINAIQQIANSEGWSVDLTTNSNSFTAANLAQYDAVIFNNTLGNVLTNAQQNAFEDYINNGGGYVGIHAAGATETGWPWYQDMIGTTFVNHPPGTPTATLNFETNTHISTSHLSQPWSINEEWYNWSSNPREESGVQILLTVDESTYTGGTNGDDHPISWCREFQGGRMFYTALGHNPAHFSAIWFREHLAGGIRWVANDKVVQSNLLLDLDANSGVTANGSNFVTRWTNKVSSSPAQDFVINNIGRSVAGSGRPRLREGVNAISGRNTLVFNEDELINFNDDAFDSLIRGSGYTWLAVLSPQDQNTDNDDNLADVNAFFGNLRNGGRFEGIWGAFEDDNSIWMGSRNGVDFTRNNVNNPHVIGLPVNSGQFYVVAGRQAAGQGTVTMELFVDDSVPHRTGQFPVNPSANSERMAIGTERDAVQHPGRESFDGEIARLLIYDRPLSNAELRQTMNALDGTYNLGLTQTAAAPAPTNNTNNNIGDTTVVHIRKRSGALAFAIDGGRDAARAQNVYLWAQNPNNQNQRWIETDLGNGFYSYEKQGTAHCLDGGRGGANLQNIYLWDCQRNNRNQHWQKVSVGSGFVQLRKRNAPGFAIDGGNNGANAQNVNLYDSSSSSRNLQWLVTPVN